MDYSKHVNAKRTPQSEPIPGREADMARNSAGGFSFGLDKWGQFERFLVLGTEGGTYYAREREMTRENAGVVIACAKEDGRRVAKVIIRFRRENRAPKMSPLLFALAVCAKLAGQDAATAANAAVPEVCGTATHLFEFLKHVKAPADSSLGSHMRLLEAAERAATATVASEVIPLIEEYGLPWECIPGPLMKDVSVNEALLRRMPMTATIRQLGRMSAVGLLKPNSPTADTVIARLADGDALRKARVHPIQALAALSTYGRGKGAKGSLTWDVNQAIVDALDGAFYAAFGNVVPTGKRTYLAIDASASMGWGDIAGIPGLTPARAAAAMAMVTARTEAAGSFHVAAFSARMIPVAITPRQRLDTAMGLITDVNWGGTNCALPMVDALEQGIKVGLFVVFTDSQTWAGGLQPCQALRQYRDRTGIPARLVVVGMTATEFTIADPADAGMMDIVGFDSAAPQIISDFARA